jgi:hypothetical protein
MVNLKAEYCTPSIYYQMSRDFQLLGRLYDVVLHSVKTDVDLLYNLPLSFNSNLDSIDLLAMTLGFIPKHKYNAKQLKAVCSVLPLIFKNKGSLQAIIILVNTILHAEGIKETVECFEKTHIDDTTGKTVPDHTILIAIPDKLQDLSLINDLLDYILPAGIGYELIQVFTVKIDGKTDLAYEDKISVKSIEIRNEDNEVTYGLLPDLTDNEVRDDIVNFGAEDTSGLLIHTTIISPEKTESESEEE